MKKLLAVMLIPFFLAPVPIISTDKGTKYSQANLFQLQQTAANQTLYFSTIPINPTAKQDITTYHDADLTLSAEIIGSNQPLQIVNMEINSQQLPVFELSNGSYIVAAKQDVTEDTIVSQRSISQDFWLQPHFTVYSQPYVYGTSSVRTSLQAFQKVHADQVATTPKGIFYDIEGKGWIAESDLSLADNRMIKVQDLLNQKYNKANYSIFVKQLDTQASVGVNADKTMYSASIAKLATLYYVQHKLNNGSIKSKDTLKYIGAVNHFYGDYSPLGSGDMPKKADNASYSIDFLLQAVAKHSDNVATNLLGYYVANQYDKDFHNHIQSLSGSYWDMEKRDLSAKEAALLMEAIYYQKGRLTTYLTKTDFDQQRIPKNIDVPVAHKIGDAYDYRHDVAIVYAKSPYIISIFTNDSSYDKITAISDDIYAILK
ncbi:serine hydrolase [Streptococcus halichoeri]|uniref:serine hydrolase n=1 Tax=Streptococcus halichoeri TaxID=254785 RepID=UPI00135C58F6|nr:serine hydrolase [Streptococcus halichoeri]